MLQLEVEQVSTIGIFTSLQYVHSNSACCLFGTQTTPVSNPSLAHQPLLVVIKVNNNKPPIRPNDRPTEKATLALAALSLTTLALTTTHPSSSIRGVGRRLICVGPDKCVDGGDVLLGLGGPGILVCLDGSGEILLVLGDLVVDFIGGGARGDVFRCVDLGCDVGLLNGEAA